MRRRYRGPARASGACGEGRVLVGRSWNGGDRGYVGEILVEPVAPAAPIWPLNPRIRSTRLKISTSVSACLPEGPRGPVAPTSPLKPRDYFSKSQDEMIFALSPEGPRGPIAPAWPDNPLKPGFYLVRCKVEYHLYYCSKQHMTLLDDHQYQVPTAYSCMDTDTPLW